MAIVNLHIMDEGFLLRSNSLKTNTNTSPNDKFNATFYIESPPHFLPDTFSKKVNLLDSTLREGEQTPGVSFTQEQRLDIARKLDEFGVNMIEISPIVSPLHQQATKTLIAENLNSKIIAHLRALPQDVDVALNCDAEWVAMFLSTSDIHLKDKLRLSKEEALQRAIVAVEYAEDHGLKSRFTAEDASRTDPTYLKEVALAVKEAGAEILSLPDTLGCLHPSLMYNLVKSIKEAVPDISIDVHCHNDLGMALSNSLAGVEAGAEQIHVCINGLGERAGITSLADATMALIMLYGFKTNVKTEMLTELSHFVSQSSGIPTPVLAPIVGPNAFRHKGGTHQAAVIQSPSTYEIMSPEMVGNTRKLVYGQYSGKTGVKHLLQFLGLDLTEEEVIDITQGLKEEDIEDFEIETSGKNLLDIMSFQRTLLQEKMNRRLLQKRKRKEV